MKPYLLNGKEVDMHDLIKEAEVYGYHGNGGVFFTSEAAKILRKNGNKVENNPEYNK